MAISEPLKDPTQLPGGLTPTQYRWLKARLGAASDAQACLDQGVSPNTLRHWKRNPSFRQVLQAIREDRWQALRLLGLHLAGEVLQGIETLLGSSKGPDIKAGVDGWRMLMRPKEGQESPEDPVHALLALLRVRGIELPGQDAPITLEAGTVYLPRN